MRAKHSDYGEGAPASARFNHAAGWEYLSASIMCADFRALPAQLESLDRAGVRCAHLDFGDGRFVPNLPLGLEVFSQLPPRTEWARECHLMIERPMDLIHLFAPHADTIIFHVEAEGDPVACGAAIRHAGAAVGVALNPSTPPEALLPLLPDVDEILVMAVEPGFAGSAFDPSVIEKVRRIRALVERVKPGLPIEVDGAVSSQTIPSLARAGASRFVGGTSGLFLGQDLEEDARALIACIEETVDGSRSRSDTGRGATG